MASIDLKNKEFKKNYNRKSKIWGISIIITCSIFFLVLFTNFLPFFSTFLMGMFGIFIYPLTLVAFAVGLALINNKKYVMPLKYVLYLSGAVYLLLCLINIIILGKPDIGFFEYFALTYNSVTAGGILCSLLLAPLLYTVGLVAAIILCVLALIVFVALIIDFLNSIKVYGFKKVTAKKPKLNETKIITKSHIDKEINPVKPTCEQEELENKEEINIFLNKKLEEENNLYEAKVKLGLIEGTIDSAKSKDIEPKSLREHLLTPPPFDMSKFNNTYNHNKKQEISSNIEALKSENDTNKFAGRKLAVFDEIENFHKTKQDDVINSQDNAPIPEEQPKQSGFEYNTYQYESAPNYNYMNPYSETTPKQEAESNLHTNNNIQFQKNEDKINMQAKPKKFATLEEETPKPVTPPIKQTSYARPPIELLETRPTDLTSLNEDVVAKTQMLERALEMFNINAKVIGVVIGPAVTRYELEMPPGVSVKKILSHEDDISLALAAKSGIRIEAPIPGKSAVGIEVPNDNVAMVSIRDIIDSVEFATSKSPIAFVLGKDISGTNQICNMNKMPHLLIAGATNSGKSVCLNAIIISILYKSSPDDVRLILIDPKCVEFALYNDLPHLLMPSVITEVEMAVNALNWAVNEMEQRFSKLKEMRCRNIDEYNSSPEVVSGEEKKMPYILIMIDELNDLMSSNKKEIEEKIMRLAQKSRAAGIHLIIATQRPSVDVITGTIKANFPSRISFALTSFNDSKTILDMGGAENLLGNGDMLYKPSDANFPRRIQGCYVSREEVESVVEYVKEHNEQDYDEEIENKLKKQQSGGDYEGVINGDRNWDPLLPQVLKMFIQNGHASISAAQRRFVIGFPRAARITDQLTEMGYLSPQEGSKPRTVYITMEEFYEKFGQID